MSLYKYPVLRMPFDLQAPDNTFNFRAKGTPASTSAQVITAGTYISDGSSAVVAPKDFVKAIKDAAQAAATAIGAVGGTVTGSLGVDGGIDLTQSGQSDTLQFYNLTANQQYYLGAAAAAVDIGSLTFQAGHQLHPGIDPVNDSGNSQTKMASEGKDLLGYPHRVVRSGLVSIRNRRVAFDYIAAARMTDDRAARSGYATFAGVAVGEPNTWENMWEYLLGAPGPYGDNRVYLYTTNDPADAVNEGAYHYLLSESVPGINGVTPGGYVSNWSVEHFQMIWMLVKIA